MMLSLNSMKSDSRGETSMFRMMFRISCLAAVALSLGQAAEISGVVHNSTGEGVASASVNIQGVVSGYYNFTTNASGEYDATGLAAGDYAVRASALPYLGQYYGGTTERDGLAGPLPLRRRAGRRMQPFRVFRRLRVVLRGLHPGAGPGSGP